MSLMGHNAHFASSYLRQFLQVAFVRHTQIPTCLP